MAERERQMNKKVNSLSAKLKTEEEEVSSVYLNQSNGLVQEYNTTLHYAYQDT